LTIQLSEDTIQQAIWSVNYGRMATYDTGRAGCFGRRWHVPFRHLSRLRWHKNSTDHWREDERPMDAAL